MFMFIAMAIPFIEQRAFFVVLKMLMSLSTFTFDGDVIQVFFLTT